jgi:DNA-binding beta-propeller fold protein YncE
MTTSRSLLFRRLAPAVLAVLLVSLSPLAARADGNPPLTAGVTVTIPASKGKFDFLGVDPAKHRLLAAHEKDGTADFIDLDANSLITRVKTGPTVGIAVDPKTGNYFASVQDNQRLAVIDSTSLKEIGSVAMGGDTDAIIFDADDRLVFVTNDNGSFLWAVDADTQKVAASIPIPSAPECMAYDPTTDRIYLNLKTANEIAVIDIKTRTITALWPTAPAELVHGLVFDPKTGWIFSSGANGKLVAVDSKTGKVVAATDTVPKVDQIAFDEVLQRVYCAGTDAISVVQEGPEGLKTLGSVKTSASAKNVAVDPKNHAVWTTYTDGTNSYATSWSVQ